MYGLKYCTRFNSQEYIENFDKNGKVFLNCTTDCLLKSVTQITREEERKKPPDCDDLYHQAFKSHVKCYLECDFCNICKTNKAALLKAYDFRDFMSREAVNQIYQVLKECGPFKCF
uniref:Uncharacterized protein n=1 Tax=Panagrolaimus sp. ES5 TaxID=591445 RepID=A0AC34FSY3_9BILA